MPWYFLPFIWLWRLAGIILNLVGRKWGIILGAVGIVLGFMQCLTLFGALMGIPVMILGGSMILRAIKMPG